MKEKKEQEVVDNAVQRIAKKLQENRNSLHIARVPEKTKQKFKELADAEFCGDYGMCLKFLMDDLISTDTKTILVALDAFEMRISDLEKSAVQKEETVEVKGRKMLDGTVKEVGKDE